MTLDRARTAGKQILASSGLHYKEFPHVAVDRNGDWFRLSVDLFALHPNRVCLEIQIAKYQNEHPEMNAAFGAARDQLLQKVAEHPEDPDQLSALGLFDAYLGRKREGIQDAKRVTEMLPVSKDAIHGAELLLILAIVYALTDESSLAFETLDILVKIPLGITYGELKLDPDLDSLRTDPRFAKLLAQLAPKE